MLGKIGKKTFDEIIYPHLGKIHSEVIIPPMNGVDTGAIQIDQNKVMVVKTDPVFIVHQFGLEKAAWFAVHILASDVMTSGIPPKYAMIDLNLPPSMTDEEFSQMWIGIDKALKEIDVMVTAGHTGRYEGVSYPMLGGFAMIGIGDINKLGSPKKVKVGDFIIVTKGPAIEATGLLTNLYPEYFKQRLPADVFEEAYNTYWKMSCWKDGLIASNVGIHMMHDATEGGLWNALVEVAEASKKRLVIYEDKLFINRAVKEVTSLVNIDPFISISEGTMIILTDNPKVKEELNKANIEAEIIGKVEKDSEYGEAVLKTSSGEKNIEKPSEDPFWRAFFDLEKKTS
ncbi:AIR synthase [Acidianus sulfidivorans JP7]|uniref:AIR synthase n=1 Tax=Acidianus sulfidivorans JP7 TaxID=619593 RepID=A0A2U9IK73_9CREN|nr:AIR synthase family protein [Acidianus sulfidivorans]AWR96385.1 AIR synthase [Acidianus sulfidivorans JP7]